MNNDYVQDYLMHHGVKGMKWGVVHDKNDSESLEKMNDVLTNKKYDLLKKYDSSDEDKKYFKDDEPLDDYENIIEDLESYAKSNGHINIDEKDINEYKELVKQQNELNDKIYGSNKEKQKIRSGRVATGAILGTIGGLGISALGLRIANRNVLRTPKTVRKGKAILISMGILGATIGSISGVASANRKIKQSK